MKKYIITVLICWLFSGCVKEIQTVDKSASSHEAITSEVSRPAPDLNGGIKPVRGIARVQYITNKDFGWVLRFPNNQIVVPLNLPEKLKVESIILDVAFVYTHQVVPCNCSPTRYYAEIKNIVVVGTAPN